MPENQDSMIRFEADRPRKLLNHMYCISGASCAGKSTVREHLADRYGFLSFDGDSKFFEYLHSGKLDNDPTMVRLRKCRENKESTAWYFLQDSDVFASFFINLVERVLPLFLNELESLADDTPVIVEIPLVKPAVLAQSFDPHKTVFLVSEMSFQREHWSKRDWFLSLLSQGEDFSAAFENWMALNQMFNDYVISECAIANTEPVWTGGVVDQAAAIKLVARKLGLDVSAEH